MARAAGAVLLVLGAALAVLPAFIWFRAPPPAAPTEATGFSGSGQLWLLPLLGAMIVLAGAGLVASRAGAARAAAAWAGPLALVAGAVALGFAIWAGADPSVTLEVTVDGVTAPVSAPVDLAPAALITPVVAGIAAALGAGAAWAARRR